MLIDVSDERSAVVREVREAVGTNVHGVISMAKATPDVEQLMSDYVDVWNGDFSKLEVVSESFDVNGPMEELHSRDEFEAHLREILAAFPDSHITIDDMLASDEVVMAEWTWTGTHEGEFNDIPPTDREVDITGASKIQIADGKLQDEQMYYDRQELFEQLGLTEE